jgi:hypothetical protein
MTREEALLDAARRVVMHLGSWLQVPPVPTYRGNILNDESWHAVADLQAVLVAYEDAPSPACDASTPE